MKILLGDDPALFREGLAELLKGLDPKFRHSMLRTATQLCSRPRSMAISTWSLLDLHIARGLDLLSALKEDLRRWFRPS
jgi:hypothetical protein